MVKNLLPLIQMFSFIQATPADQQAQAVSALFRAGAPTLLKLSQSQVELVIGLFNNPKALSPEGIPDEEVINDFFDQFKEAADPVPPLRVCCKNCGTMNKVILNV